MVTMAIGVLGALFSIQYDCRFAKYCARRLRLTFLVSSIVTRSSDKETGATNAAGRGNL